MARHKNMNWSLPEPKVETWQQAQVAILMDIRDELQGLNRIIGCPNFTRIPLVLDQIVMNTKKPNKRITQKKTRRKP